MVQYLLFKIECPSAVKCVCICTYIVYTYLHIYISIYNIHNITKWQRT